MLLSCHICHPSLCNDNLSGISVAAFLAQWLSTLARRRLSYRFLFIPGTIGSITWLARNQDRLAAIRHGLVLTGLGGPGELVYKRSRRGDADIDRAAAHVLSTGAKTQSQGLHPRTATTSVSTVRRGSIWPSAACRARLTVSTRNTIRPRTIWSFVAPGRLEDSYRACQSILSRSMTTSRT